MATSDRGLVDVERYDLEPSRPVLHGLLGDVDASALSGLTNPEKIPHVLRLVDAAGLSARGAASLVEIGHRVSTWPQLAGDVRTGAGAVAEAVRRIGLGEMMPSGRTRIDVGAALDHLTDPCSRDSATEPPHTTEPVRDGAHVLARGAVPADVDGDCVDVVVAAAMRAPSGGNAQPWRVRPSADAVTIALAPEHTSTMDVKFRGSAVALGAAVFNARVAAAAHEVLGQVTLCEGGTDSPLEAIVRLGTGANPALSAMYPTMLDRETNRNYGAPTRLDRTTVDLLRSAADGQGAALRLATAPEDICAAAAILGEADRIRYLTPRLHADMVGELRWPQVGELETGIDVRSLELDPGQLAVLELLRRPDVMSQLADWDGGAALGADTRSRVAASAALGVVCVRGSTLADYARGGSAVEAVWIAAQRLGLAVQPVSPVFLYARDRDDLVGMSARYAPVLHRLQSEFLELMGTPVGELPVLVIRLFQGPPPSVRSRRRDPAAVCAVMQ